MAQAWVVRAGKHGERESWALQRGVSGGGWFEVPDLSDASTREAVAVVVAAVFSDLSPAAQANYTGQLWALRGRIQVGDLLAMPMKTTQEIAVGRVTRAYNYLADELDPAQRHVVHVDWVRTDVPRANVKQDLLYTLGSALSIFAPTKNRAVQRLEAILRDGQDPGAVAPVADGRSAGVGTSVSADVDEVTDDDVDEPELHADIEQVAADRIRARIGEDFAGHEMAFLVGAVLEAEGFRCKTSPPGADRGIDIVAGRGVLGAESPRLIVQVKSGGPVGDVVLRDLMGVVSSQGADLGLLVAWGGLTKPARDTVYGQQFRLRVWTADDLIEAITRVYERLPEETQSKLPLKRVWVLADDG